LLLGFLKLLCVESTRSNLARALQGRAYEGEFLGLPGVGEFLVRGARGSGAECLGSQGDQQDSDQSDRENGFRAQARNEDQSGRSARAREQHAVSYQRKPLISLPLPLELFALLERFVRSDLRGAAQGFNQHFVSWC